MKKLLLVVSLFVSTFSIAQTWSEVGTGTSDAVGSIISYNGNVYVGGAFLNAGGVGVNGFAAWNGSKWSSVSSTASEADCMAVYNGELYIAGSFTSFGGVYSPNIVRWNGTTWSALGKGVNIYATIMGMVVYKGSLCITGLIDSAGGVPVTNIASWNGTAWSSVGNGVDVKGGNGANAITVYNNNLIVAGLFNTASGVPVNYIAQWNGTSWSALGSGLGVNLGYAMPNTLTVYNGNLYVGGYLDSAGSMAVNNIAQWNGTTWDTVGLGTNDIINSLTSYNGKLYAGGQFTSAGNVLASFIASWDGTKWSAVDLGMGSSGVGSAVSCVYPDDSVLFAGGYFSSAGGNIANNIAQLSSVTGINEITKNSEEVQVFPNPSNGVFNFQLGIKNYESEKVEVYNIMGEKIYNNSFNSTSAQIDLSNQPAGIYLYRIVSETGEQIASGKLIIQK